MKDPWQVLRADAHCKAVKSQQGFGTDPHVVRTTAVLPIPGEVIVDLTRRKAQFHRCPADSLPHRQVAIENPVKFASDPNRLRPSLV